jgi:hypothetical protein
MNGLREKGTKNIHQGLNRLRKNSKFGDVLKGHDFSRAVSAVNSI